MLGAALVQLDRRPLIAGILFGLLAYKPQFGLMIPLALAASGRWRSFAAAAATVALLAAGDDHRLRAACLARVPRLRPASPAWSCSNRAIPAGTKFKASSPGRACGAGRSRSPTRFRASSTVALGGALIWLWRGSARYPLKAAALCLAAILATPYSFDYDMMVLAPAIAFFAADGLARGFGPWEKTALAALWLAPLVARSVAHMTLIPFGVLAMLAVFILLLRRSTIQFTSPMAFPGAFLLK